MIPLPEPASGNLPPGTHRATWEEVVARYGYNPRRLDLLSGLKAALDDLRGAGCRRVYLDGSFVTSAEQPGDYDACWEGDGVDPGLLDPVLLDFTNHRRAQKAKYGGELFLADQGADAFGARFLEFFQTDKATGDRKGIVMIDLRGVP